MKNIPPPACEAQTAHDLLVEIALLKESADPADLKQANRQFVQLLTEYEKLIRALAQTMIPFDGSTIRFDTDDLYSQVALKIWDNAHKFDPTGNDPYTIKKQFIGWTKAILKNIVHDHLGQFELELTSTETLTVGWDGFVEATPEPTERAKIVAEILEGMDPDDAEILRWTAMVKPLDGTQMRPDPEERQRLCRKLNVTQVGLRKKRQRALENFRAEFERRGS